MKSLTKALASILGYGIAATTAMAADNPVSDGASQIHYTKSTQLSFTGSEENFTGQVAVNLLFPSTETTNYSGAYVTFQPQARTAWHAHPGGQHMVVILGTAVTATRDGQVVHAKAGEAVWCPKDIDHWHGATSEQAMKHLVITGSENGENVIWKEKVSDDEYRRAALSTASH